MKFLEHFIHGSCEKYNTLVIWKCSKDGEQKDKEKKNADNTTLDEMSNTTLKVLIFAMDFTDV